MEKKNWLEKTIDFFENNFFFICIRNGLITLMPLIFIGSFSLLFTNFPAKEYQDFIKSFGDGFFYKFFNGMYNGTFGFFSVFLTVSISFHFIRKYTKKFSYITITMLTSLACFFILSPTMYDTKKCLVAILCGLFVPFFLIKLIRIRRLKIKAYSYKATSVFHETIEMVLPVSIVVVVVGLLGLLTTNFLPGVQHIFMKMFEKMGVNLGSTILLEFLSHFFWFLGIHGPNVLEEVLVNLYEPYVGQKILSKSFLDTFVLMGGSGCGIAMLVSIFIASRDKKLKKVATHAVGPAIFNINEPLLFGIPIVLNPILLVPFIISPVMCLIISYLATYWKIVPMINKTMTWTTPIFISGYYATGSIKGSILQFINLFASTAIYLPFIIYYEKYSNKAYQDKVERIYAKYQEALVKNPEAKLFDFDPSYTGTAKSISAQLSMDARDGNIMMYYQPIVDKDRNVFALEALLRYKINEHFVNPELLLKLANEDKYLYELHLSIFKRILQDKKENNYQGTVSFNVNFDIMSNPSFSKDLIDLTKEYGIECNQFIIEVTEEVALSLSSKLIQKIEELSNAGFKFAIDDFAAGSTSLKYVQMGFFQLVKVDGVLTKNILSEDGKSSLDIISSIKYLGSKSDFNIVCEFVENEQMFSMLKEIGIDFYQGYLFSKAMPMSEIKNNY